MINKGNLHHQTINKGNLYHQTINKGNLYHRATFIWCKHVLTVIVGLILDRQYVRNELYIFSIN